MPVAPFSRRDSATRPTPKRLAASVTLISLNASLSTSPGWQGLCIWLMSPLLVVVLKVTATPSKSLHRMLSPKGNPSMDNLAAIFDAIRKCLKVSLKAHTVNLQKVA
jgi:hypothetical protein